MDDPFEDRIDPEDVADVLAVVADPPNLRGGPRPYDLVGDYDEWFDGGAVKHETGYSEYTLDDGTIVTVEVSERLSVIIRFGERIVVVKQLSAGDLAQDDDEE